MRTNSAESDLAALRAQLAALQAKVEALETQGHFNSSRPDPVAGPAVTDRRGMMKKMAGLVAGVAAAGLLRPSSSRGKPVPDGNFDGDPMIIGGINAATFNTDLIEGSDSSFRVLSAALSDAPSIVGRNTNVIVPNPAERVAIFGATDATGSTTPNANIVGVYGSAVSSGSGTHTGVRGTGDDYGVLGSGATGVFGAGNDRGVSGTGTTGVFGSSGVSNGAGVRGEANSGTSAHAVEGISTSGVGGDFQGARAALYLESGAGAVADPNMNPPSGGTFGDVYRGSASASLWYRAGGTNPYRRLADSTTAGALTTFAIPSIFVNTISGSGNTYDGQHVTANSVNPYQIGGVTFGGNAVPSDARAVIGRIADPNPAATGALLVAGANPPPTGTGVIAVAPGAPENSAFISGLDATGKLYVKGAFAAGSTDVIIIIGGYYL